MFKMKDTRDLLHCQGKGTVAKQQIDSDLNDSLLYSCTTGSLINPSIPIVHFCLHCTQVLRQQKGWDRRTWLGHLQGDMHMVAAIVLAVKE